MVEISGLRQGRKEVFFRAWLDAGECTQRKHEAETMLKMQPIGFLSNSSLTLVKGGLLKED